MFSFTRKRAVLWPTRFSSWEREMVIPCDPNESRMNKERGIRAACSLVDRQISLLRVVHTKYKYIYIYKYRYINININILYIYKSRKWNDTSIYSASAAFGLQFANRRLLSLIRACTPIAVATCRYLSRTVIQGERYYRAETLRDLLKGSYVAIVGTPGNAKGRHAWGESRGRYEIGGVISGIKHRCSDREWNGQCCYLRVTSGCALFLYDCMAKREEARVRQ